MVDDKEEYMKARFLMGLLLFIIAVINCGTAWPLDEAVLTPTPEREGAMTQKDKAKAEKEFNAAMSVWYKHDYPDSPGSHLRDKNGEKLLGQFARV